MPKNLSFPCSELLNLIKVTLMKTVESWGMIFFYGGLAVQTDDTCSNTKLSNYPPLFKSVCYMSKM